MSNAQPGGYYFAPPSHWPVVGSTALFFIAVGGVLLMNSYGAGLILVAWILGIVEEAEVGKVYDGKVVTIVDFGAFVNFMGSRCRPPLQSVPSARAAS